MTTKQNHDEEEQWMELIRHAGIHLEVLDWRDTADVEAVCGILSLSPLDFKTRNKVKAFLQRCSNPVFRVEAKIKNALSARGFRAAVYNIADGTSAFYASSNPEKPIRYGSGDDSSTLLVTLFFRTNDKALAFSKRLRNSKVYDKWCCDLHNLQFAHVDKVPTRLPGRDDLQPVAIADYCRDETKDWPEVPLSHFFQNSRWH